MKIFYTFIVILSLIISTASYSQELDITDAISCIPYINSQTPIDELPFHCQNDYGRFFIAIDVMFEADSVPSRFKQDCTNELRLGSGNICEQHEDAFIGACLQDLNLAYDNDCLVFITTFSEVQSQCPTYTPRCTVSTLVP